MGTPTLAERREAGRAARKLAPRSSHGDWAPAPDRRDPVELLQEQNVTRVQWLVPVRHARMAVSPFTFFRGGARIMAADLAGTPDSGLQVQLGGDAHLSNFGAYASPERTLIIDANDFDETLPGPWEWDLKRLAASFLIAGRHIGLGTSDRREITERAVRSYRRSMAEFADMGYLDLWYQMSDVHHIAELVDATKKAQFAHLVAIQEKALTRTSLQALRKLTIFEAGKFHWRSEHPVLVPIREVLPEHRPEDIDSGVRETLAQYSRTLRSDHKMLLERYELVDIALKVVGVGSVGTRCYVLLLQGRDRKDPLFLQAKEANASVLEEFLEPSQYDHHGHRVVAGQRMIQAHSDIFLGWATGRFGPNYYVRQLRDWKASFDVEKASRSTLSNYARICGHILARGHARTGDPEAMSAYMGSSATFDAAIVTFAERYEAQNLADFRRFKEAIADRALPAAPEPYN